MRVDAHTHIWRAVAAPQAATIVSGQCDVPVELLHEYLDEHEIDRAVLVQPIYPGTDNLYVADTAAADPRRLAAVCVVDPRRRCSGSASLLGDRAWLPRTAPAPAYCGRGGRLRRPGNVAVVGDRRELGAVVSVLAGPEHLPTIGALAERFAPVNIVLDHFAHPRLAEPARDIAGLLALARFENVHIKASGYYYFSGEPYPYRDCRTLVVAVFDAFGPARLLWGSDFPHVLLKSGYARSLQLVGCATAGSNPAAVRGVAQQAEDVDLFCGRLSTTDREKILGENAVRLYWPGSK